MFALRVLDLKLAGTAHQILDDCSKKNESGGF
jgi:hypothetical protein